MRNLKLLYEILWVEIKDKPRVYSLQREANVLFLNDEICKEEYNELNKSLYKDWDGFMLLSNTKNRKHFVKKMIHKLGVCPWLGINDNISNCESPKIK